MFVNIVWKMLNFLNLKMLNFKCLMKHSNNSEIKFFKSLIA